MTDDAGRSHYDIADESIYLAQQAFVEAPGRMTPAEFHQLKVDLIQVHATLALADAVAQLTDTIREQEEAKRP